MLVIFQPSNASPPLTIFSQHYMHRFFRGHMFRAPVAELEQVDIGKELLTGPEERRRDGKLDVVKQSSAQKLLNGRHSSPDANVFSVCGRRSAPLRRESPR